MSELDEAWAIALAEPEYRTRLPGRSDVADYLALRNSNDLLRTAGIDWLIASFTNFAGDANRQGASLQIAGDDGHRFRIGAPAMLGRFISLQNGVSQMIVEPGWPHRC